MAQGYATKGCWSYIARTDTNNLEEENAAQKTVTPDNIIPTLPETEKC